LANQGRHTKLPLAEHGIFARKEWVLLGLNCEDCELLFRELVALIPKASLAYLDTEHKGVESKNRLVMVKEGKESIFYSAQSINEIKNLCNDVQALIINGNHHQGSAQILFMNEEKKESIRRRSNEINRPVVVAAMQDTMKPQEFFHDFEFAELVDSSVFLSKKEEVLKYLQTEIMHPVKLKGLVLAGGKSERMGRDKTQLEYYHKPHWLYMFEMLSQEGLETYVSCRSEQKDKFPSVQVLVDKIDGIGPTGAILTAFMSDPNSAWLVVASDMPNIQKSDLHKLLSERNSGSIATTFVHKESGFSEPLFAIYEPSAYLKLYQELALGRTCPRKFLGKYEIHRIPIENEESFQNVNTQDDFKAWTASSKK
jgi:molybdopterin-guanine dinucleotide biosynthesis protein A